MYRVENTPLCIIGLFTCVTAGWPKESTMTDDDRILLLRRNLNNLERELESMRVNAILLAEKELITLVEDLSGKCDQINEFLQEL